MEERKEEVIDLEKASQLAGGANKMLSFAAMSAMLAGSMGGGGGRLGLHKGENRKARNLDASEGRAKGLRGYAIKDGEWLAVSDLIEIVGQDNFDNWALSGDMRGLIAFGVDVIYAGSEKAAIKKWNLINKQKQA